MTIKMERILEVLEAAKDAGDECLIAACRRLMLANIKGWKKHHNPADYLMVLDFLA